MKLLPVYLAGIVVVGLIALIFQAFGFDSRPACMQWYQDTWQPAKAASYSQDDLTATDTLERALDAMPGGTGHCNPGTGLANY